MALKMGMDVHMVFSNSLVRRMNEVGNFISYLFIYLLLLSPHKFCKM